MNTKHSDTPRTDAFELVKYRPQTWADFARQLERENAALKAGCYRVLGDCASLTDAQMAIRAAVDAARKTEGGGR